MHVPQDLYLQLPKTRGAADAMENFSTFTDNLAYPVSAKW